EGRNGIRTIVEKVTTTGGVEIEREVISTEVTTTPVSRVVQVGTKVREEPVDPEDTEAPEETETEGDEETSGDSLEQDDSEELKEGKRLPATATSVPVIGAVGLALTALGSMLSFFKKKK